jgi:hypothetical protein
MTFYKIQIDSIEIIFKLNKIKMEKLKLHFNELDLIGQTRQNGVLNTIYLHELGIDESLDSGFKFDDNCGDKSTVASNSSFKQALQVLEPNLSTDINGIYHRIDSDDNGSIYVISWIDEAPVILIDWVNGDRYSILIHMKKSEGKKEEIVKIENHLVNKAFQNYLEFGVFNLNYS